MARIARVVVPEISEIKRNRPELAAKIERFDLISPEEFLQINKKDKK